MIKTKRIVERFGETIVHIEVVFASGGAVMIWASPEQISPNIGSIHVAAAGTSCHVAGVAGSSEADEANQAMAERLARAHGVPQQIFVCCSQLSMVPEATSDPRFLPMVERRILRAIREGPE